MKVMLECSKFSPQQKLDVKNLFLKYWPIETDPTVPEDIKAKAMMDWWVSDLEIFTDHSLNLTERDFQAMVNSSRLAMRHGVMELMNSLRENEIPMVIVSGGI